MCCVLATLALFGPRLGIILWWLVEPVRWGAAFDTFIWPFLGFLFLPWTTLAYVFVFTGGVETVDWLLIGFGLFLDIASYGGGAYGNRNRIPGYSDTYTA